MRFLLALALLAPAVAFAQQPLPITLTPYEYQVMLSDLMGRDPAIRMLVQKQQEQQKAAQVKPEAPPEAAKPEAPFEAPK